MKMYDVSIVISEIEEPDVEIPPGTEIPTKELGVTPLIMTESLDEAKEIYNLCSELGDSIRKIAVFNESDEWPNKSTF